MIVSWESIVEVLRAELAEYGSLLNLFEEQQRSLFQRDAETVLRLSGEIEQQVRTADEVRRNRERTVAAFAASHQQPANATLRSLLPLVITEARPLIEALIGEVNRLIHRIRRVTRHNHMLLSRVVETHQETLRHLRPDAYTKTYSPDGRVCIAGTRPAPALQIAG
jgi:flagellar biosynthesis/type III secretory pathway chaperone